MIEHDEKTAEPTCQEAASNDVLGLKPVRINFHLGIRRLLDESAETVEEPAEVESRLKGRAAYDADFRRKQTMEAKLDALKDKSLDLERFDDLVESDEFVELRKAITEKANYVVTQQGLRRGMKAVDRALRLRSPYLLLKPNRFDSPRIKLWSRGIKFGGFRGIIRDEYGAWALVYDCDFSGTKGLGFSREKVRKHFTQALRFEVKLSEETSPEQLFA